jgi:hypothetical protein
MKRLAALALTISLPCAVLAQASEAASAPAAARAEPAVQRTVVEDEGVRIDELRVRGQNRRIAVQSKALGAAPYEIVMPEAARDMSQAHGGAAGRSVWQLFGF